MLPPLRRIGRRVRAFAGLEGGIAGGTVTALALSVVAAMGRFGAGATLGSGRAWCRSPWAAFGAVAVGCALGALGRAARPVSLCLCARLADRALDGEDRILSALSIDEGASPLAAALRADAVGRLRQLIPRQAFAARRPPGLVALGLAALTLAAATSFPRPSRAPRAPKARMAAGRALPADALDEPRRQARAAAAEAERLDDRNLGRVAAAVAEALGGLTSGELEGGTALDRLRELAAQAAAGAGAAERDRRAFRAALAAFDARASTRVVARSLDTGDAESAAHGLADSAREHPRQTGAALAAAAAGVPAATAEEGALDQPNLAADDESADSKPGARRLARDGRLGSSERGAPKVGERAEDPRQLEQLRRDLERDATACRDGGAACAASAPDRARDLAAVGRRGAAAESWRRLERTAADLATRAGRGELAESSSPSARAFEQAARAGRDGETAARSAISLSADGIGRQPGGEPLGAGGGPDPARASDVRVRLADGQGPNRASTIEGAARSGFAEPGYARVFTDYAAAVEDALGTSGVPDDRRYLVRRYFELIRPRAAIPIGGDRP